MNSSSAPTPPVPPSGARHLGTGPYRDRERPFWGEIDLLLAVVWFAFASVVASIVTVTAATIGGGDVTDSPVYALFFGTLVFQFLQATYPWLVSRRKGLGIGYDWKFAWSLPADIFYGIGLAVCCLLGAQLATMGTGILVGLENTEDASNTDILTDNQDSVWIFGIIFLVVVGAPLAEELLFRGLILRTLQKSFGKVFAVLVSSVLFALPHWQAGATWQETTVLLSALAVVGIVFAIGAVVTDRLGPPIIAHFIFNATGVVATLG